MSLHIIFFHKMKFLFIFLVAVLSSPSTANVFDEVEKIGYAQAHLLFYFMSSGYSECENKTNVDLKAQHEKTTECIKNITYDGSFCSSYFKKFKSCIKNLLEKNGNCDSPFMNTLKNSVMDAVIAEFEYLCSTDGEHILELVNPCVISSALKSYNCKTLAMKPYPRAINLTEVCSVFPDVLNCLEKEIRNNCQKNLTRNTLHDFFSVLVKPCNVALDGYIEFIKFIFRH